MVYNDNVNSAFLREWLDSNPVSLEDGLRHDKCLCMMYPRLRLQEVRDRGINTLDAVSTQT
jgi:hypothetical protein